MRWKWPLLISLGLALCAVASAEQSVSGDNSKSRAVGTAKAERPAVYIARALSVSAAGRDAFVSCLRQKELPVWRTLKRDGLLAEQSVFETTSVRLTGAGVPAWNFLLLTHLAASTTPDIFLGAEKKRERKMSPGSRCEDAPGVEKRRVEVLYSTPNSYYPRPPDRTRASDVMTEFSLPYIIEYVAVRETPAALNEYRETMRSEIGPAVGQLIREGLLLNLIALETVSVKYMQPGMPRWNQIHIRGYSPEGRANLDMALRRVNPQGGGFAGVFGRLDNIRTKPREDMARQLPELAVR